LKNNIHAILTTIETSQAFFETKRTDLVFSRQIKQGKVRKLAVNPTRIPMRPIIEYCSVCRTYQQPKPSSQPVSPRNNKSANHQFVTISRYIALFTCVRDRVKWPVASLLKTNKMAIGDTGINVKHYRAQRYHHTTNDQNNSPGLL
jgi:hypothetical protein